MALQMARPYKHPKTGVYYFRQRVPTDLRTLLGDKIVSRSLLTKDPELAKLRNVGEFQKQAMIWERHRKRPEPLPHAQIVALSGILYRDVMATLEQEPGEASIWEEVLKLLDRVASTPNGLAKWYGPEADRLLLEEGIVTDDASRARLLHELDRALRQAAEQQLMRAEGDYSPDPKANRFPALSAAPKVSPQGVTIRSLFGLWERDHLADGKTARTVVDFRHKVEALITYLGHDDALRVTSENIADWCDHLRYESQTPLSAKTVSQKYLAVTKLVFATGFAKKKLKVNPAADVQVKFNKKTIQVRPKGYTDEEARAILIASLADPAGLGGRSEENKRAIRWGPWICAFTGARITEVMQLRTDDLLFETVDGKCIPCLRITPEAGSVKTGSYRMVPVHPQLQDMGLIDLFQSLPAGPVFYNLSPRRGKPADPVERAQNAGAKVGTWVREDVKITDKKVQPNHAWRHRFKTLARDVGISPEYMDVIQGHEDGRASSGYGETTIKALWREIQKLPRWDIPGA